MKPDPQQVTAAKLEAEAARTRLFESPQRLQVRLSPGNLA